MNQMKAAKTPKNLKEMSYAKQKKSFPILQTSSKRLKLTIQTYQMRNSEAWTTSRQNIKSIFVS